MKIAIIGGGNIGGTLGKKWSTAGYTVHFGVRNPADRKYAGLQLLGQVLPIAEALEDIDTVLLSLPGVAVNDFAVQHGAALAKKTIFDATNNMRAPKMNGLSVLKDKAPGAKLVRAFNNLGWENFANPRLGGIQIDLFYCADGSARPVADQLISDVGLRPVYIGDLSAAATVDELTRLWFDLAVGQGYGRRIAFKMLKED